MEKPKLSIIIPSYKDPYLNKTIQSLLDNSELPINDMEIICILDGYWQEVPKDPRVKVVHLGQSVGMREGINTGVSVSKGDYIMKCDAHCSFDKGFDIKLLSTIEDNWIVVPKRYELDVEKWVIEGEPIEYERLLVDNPEKITGSRWRSRSKGREHILVDETMIYQGSCYLMSRKHWNWLGGLDSKNYGNITQEAEETALKTWLGGGKVMVNKTTWYAHRHRRFGRTFKSNSELGNAYSRDYWLNNKWNDRIHDLQWLLDKFYGRPDSYNANI